MHVLDRHVRVEADMNRPEMRQPPGISIGHGNPPRAIRVLRPRHEMQRDGEPRAASAEAQHLRTRAPEVSTIEDRRQGSPGGERVRRPAEQTPIPLADRGYLLAECGVAIDL